MSLPTLEVEVKIADHTILVQDDQIMVFVPGGDGQSEPLTENVVRSLEALAQGAALVLRKDPL